MFNKCDDFTAAAFLEMLNYVHYGSQTCVFTNEEKQILHLG